MQTTIVGLVVGLVDESWPGRDGKPGGRRVALYVQTNETGLAAPTQISIMEQHRSSVAGLTLGVKVDVPVMVDTFKDSRELWIKSTGAVRRVNDKAA